ncbi:protein shisa-5-like isoform X1 [Simochromis diagramma]|uniref:protein shisa-5-like isoform X1 n=1 Tax=Simochromis diagramma TaxID=43689 RepID=UPI001A7ECD09|nr:protein shisa-5-like isoform X1 [Simochromis diagramma]
MASGLCCAAVLALFVILSPCVSAGDDCLAYSGKEAQECRRGFCCGDCNSRYCCLDPSKRFDEDRQEECSKDPEKNFQDQLTAFNNKTLLILIVGMSIIPFVFLIFCCCVCPSCCLYKLCNKREATTQVTMVSNTPQHPTAAPGPPESYQEMPHHLPQPGYPAQPILTPPYHGQSFTVGPPPSYQEAISPAYPPMPYGQAAFMPRQPAYPQPPCPQPKPSAPPATPDFLAQPAYNPDFASSPH